MKEFLSHLAEGVYDKGIFKAFFLAGGPGSGKTFVTQNVFAGSGLKLVNSDQQFERKLIAADYSLSMPPEEIKGREIKGRANYYHESKVISETRPGTSRTSRENRPGTYYNLTEFRTKRALAQTRASGRPRFLLERRGARRIGNDHR